MTALLEQAIDRIRQLPDTEQDEIAGMLLEDLNSETVEVDTELTPVQFAELDRRLADSIARPEAVTPWETLRARLLGAGSP